MRDVARFVEHLLVLRRLSAIDLSRTDITTKDVIQLLKLPELSTIDVFDTTVRYADLSQLDDEDAAPHRYVHIRTNTGHLGLTLPKGNY